MQFKHKDNQNRGVIDLGGNIRVEIQADGTFTLPPGTPSETVERLKAVGHTPLTMDTQPTPAPTPAAAPMVDDELDTMGRRELYRLAQENGILVQWSGAGADSTEDIRRKLRGG